MSETGKLTGGFLSNAHRVSDIPLAGIMVGKVQKYVMCDQMAELPGERAEARPRPPAPTGFAETVPGRPIPEACRRTICRASPAFALRCCPRQ